MEVDGYSPSRLSHLWNVAENYVNAPHSGVEAQESTSSVSSGSSKILNRRDSLSSDYEPHFVNSVKPSFKGVEKFSVSAGELGQSVKDLLNLHYYSYLLV